MLDPISSLPQLPLRHLIKAEAGRVACKRGLQGTNAVIDDKAPIVAELPLAIFAALVAACEDGFRDDVSAFFSPAFLSETHPLHAGGVLTAL